jgi:ATP-dependent helicase/nuclease subunit B
MGHRIVTGSFEALESVFIDDLRELQSGDPLARINVLVGSNVLAAYLKKRIAVTGRGAANLRFHTFLDLAHHLGNPVSLSEGKSRLGGLGAPLIIESILAAGAPAVFQGVSGYAGFRDALLGTFRDLRDAGMGPETLERSLQSMSSIPPDRKRHLEGVAWMYRRFREEAQAFREVDDDFREALGNTLRSAGTLDSRLLLVYGIYDVTGQQADLLSALKDHLEMHYFIPFVDESVSAFAARFLDARADELGVAPERVEPQPRSTELARLWLQDCGFRAATSRSADTGARAAGDGSVCMVSAPGDSRVALEIAREIVRALADGTIDGFGDAAVILRHPEDDLPTIVETFRLRGIPYYIHGGLPFRDRPFCRAVMTITELAPGDFGREAILGAMELTAASLPEEDAGLYEVSEWRSLTNDARFLAGLDSWDKATSGLVSELDRVVKETAASAASLPEDSDTPRQELSMLQTRLESARQLRAAWRKVRYAADDWPSAQTWPDWARFLEEKLAPLLEASHDWIAFLQVLDQISSLGEVQVRSGSGPEVPRERLSRVLAESMRALTSPAGRFLRSGVNLLSVSAARGLRFPLVLIPDLEEARFPARLRQDPLLLDDERSRVGSGDRMPLRKLRFEEERLLFDMTARSAERRLVLLTSRLDEGSDRERIPSDFFMRAASVMARKPVTLRELTEAVIPGHRSVSLDDPAPNPGLPAVDRAEIRLRLVRSEPGRGREVLEKLAEAEPELFHRPLAYDQARWQARLSQYDGLITDRQLLAYLRTGFGPGAGPYSAGRIEEYARCPYLFYQRRVMQLAPWEEPEAAEALNPIERGSAVHEVLEGFIRGLIGLGLPRERSGDLRDLMLAFTSGALENARPAGIPDLLWEVERDRLLALMEEWLRFELGRSDGGLIPSAVELPFGPFAQGKDSPGLVIVAGRHRFMLRGIVDRIDTSPDAVHARVIDYKVGKLPDSMKRGTALLAGERIQLPVYRAAVPTIAGFEGLGSIEGEFLHLQPGDGKIVPRRFTAAELEDAWGRLPAVLEIVGDGIEAGVFFARTSGLLHGGWQCNYCDYTRICGKDRQQREERKAADPHVLCFNRIREIDVAAED